MSKTESGTSGEFVRRRFSLTREANDLIDDLAEAQHGGNRSACVRAAIFAQAQRRDEDELRHGLKRLQNEINTLSKQVESLQKNQPQDGNLSEQSQSDIAAETAQASRGGNSSRGADSSSRARIARELYSIMRNQEKAVFEVSDLLPKVECTLSSVAAGIERLVEQNAVEVLEKDGSPQYRLNNS